jgi:hypothetical protein
MMQSSDCPTYPTRYPNSSARRALKMVILTWRFAWRENAQIVAPARVALHRTIDTRHSCKLLTKSVVTMKNRATKRTNTQCV